MTVMKITEEQKEAISGVEYAPQSFYNPVQDGNGSWIISVQEAEAGGILGEIIEYVP